MWFMNILKMQKKKWKAGILHSKLWQQRPPKVERKATEGTKGTKDSVAFYFWE